MFNTLEIDKQKVSYKVSGEGADIVLLHGWGCDLTIFDKIHENLAENFRVYSVDFPGFGKSEAPKEVWGVEKYTLFTEKLLNRLNIENPILLGHSFGGRVSILYASRNPVRKLILADSAGVKPKRKLKYYLKVYSFKAMKKILPLVVGKKKANEKINNYRKKAGSADYNNAPGIMQKILVKVVNEDLKKEMPKIKSPTLLMWGENDTATPVRDARIMEKLIKGSGLVVFKNAGHYAFIDKQYEFLIVLNNFLEKDKT